MRGLAFAVALFWASVASAQEGDRVAPLSAVGEVFATVLDAGNSWDAVVIQLPRGDAFLQFAREGAGLTLDFPVFTPEQAALLPRLEALLAEADIVWQVVPLDGGETLVAPLGPKAEAVALQLAGKLFGVRAGTEVRFEMIEF